MRKPTGELEGIIKRIEAQASAIAGAALDAHVDLTSEGLPQRVAICS